MQRFALWSKALAVVLAVTLSGCIKSKQHWTIYPDGSGKVEVENTLMGMMAQMVKMGGQMGGPGAEGGAPQDPLDMIRDSVKGKVYWTKLETEDGPAGEFILRGVAYFENIADVNTGEEGKGSVEWKKNDDGSYTLVMTNEEMADGIPGLPPGMGGDEEEGTLSPEEKAQQEQMKAMMMGMLAGFEVSLSFTGPGEVTAIEGFQNKEGRTATFRLGEEEVKKMMRKELKPPTKMSATFATPSSELDAEFNAFKKELAAAKQNAQGQGGDKQDEDDSEGGKKDESDSEGGKQEQGGSKAF